MDKFEAEVKVGENSLTYGFRLDKDKFTEAELNMLSSYLANGVRSWAKDRTEPEVVRGYETRVYAPSPVE